MSAQRATDGTRTRGRLRIGAGTDVGRVRALNEDVDVARPKRGLFACGACGSTATGVVVAVQSAQEQTRVEADIWNSDDRTVGHGMR